MRPVQALAAGVGPRAAGWEAAAAALKAAKTDVSKPVRDAAAAALPLVSGLQDFIAAGAPAEQWPVVCGSLLAAEAGGKRMSPGGRAAPTIKQAAADEPTGGAWGYIPAVHPPPVLAPAPGSMPPQAHWAAGVPPSAPAPPVSQAGPGMGAVPAPLAMGFGPAMDAPGISLQQLAVQLAAVTQQQAHLAATLASFTAATQSALQQMQQQLSRLSVAVRTPAAMAGGSPGPSQQALPLSPGPAATPSASPGAAAQAASPASPNWEAAYGQLLGPDGASVAGDQQAQFRLLRCMAKSGPVWEHLSAGTGQRLLAAITDFLQAS